VTVYFNEAGEIVKFIVRNRATDILTNSVTGKTVVNRGVWQEIFTRIDGTDEFTHALVGFRFMGTSPGEGLVLQDVGRIEYSPDERRSCSLPATTAMSLGGRTPKRCFAPPSPNGPWSCHSRAISEGQSGTERAITVTAIRPLSWPCRALPA
jgi:hypothetical protein